MKWSHSIGMTACLVAVLSSLLVTLGAAAERPNILIIFTDDQGYADLGCYGSQKNKTPRMDQLANEGMRFTNFYAQTVCGPSRSALLTGRYPIRSKGWSMPAEEITWAELIRDVGYQTACIGKWDVSNRKPILPRMPNAQGFDYYFGPLGANDSGRVTFHENNQPAGRSRDMGSLLRLYTDKAIEYLKTGRDADKPFVLYLAHTMMHTIIDASPKFRGSSAGGLYGDVVEEFDHETGRLLDVVDELGLRENTLVIYTTDNGPWNQPAYTDKKKGHPEGSIFWGDAGPLRAGKGSCYEGGVRVPCIVRWPGKVPSNTTSDAIFSTLDLMPTFANLARFAIPNDRVIDGVDQTDLLMGKSPAGSRDTFLYQQNAFRKGKWKYLKAEHQVPGYAVDHVREKVVELYDLESDIGETTNLASKHPEIVAELQRSMTQLIQLEPPKTVATYSNVAYGDHERHVLDYWQADAVRPTPVFVWIHGGGFRGGNKSSIPAGLLEPCLEAGISCASIHYRLSSHAPYPAQMHDSARAIQFIRSKADDWNLDPTRVAAGGGSAGSGISQWLAFHDDLAQPGSHDIVARQSTRLVCAIPINMQSTYDPREIKSLIPGDAYKHPALLLLFDRPEGWNWDEAEIDSELNERLRDASPIHHLTPDDVPVFLIHYERSNKPGNIHHSNFGKHLKREMDALGIECVRRMDSDYQSMSAAYTEMVRFLQKHFE